MICYISRGNILLWYKPLDNSKMTIIHAMHQKMIQTHQNLPAVTFIYPFREDSNIANKSFHLMRVPKFIDDPIREKRHRRHRNVRVVSLAKIRFLMENDF